jgi:hypothetical protein
MVLIHIIGLIQQTYDIMRHISKIIMSVQFLANFMGRILSEKVVIVQLVTDFTTFCMEPEAS